jgi:hypothetical protein
MCQRRSDRTGGSHPRAATRAGAGRPMVFTGRVLRRDEATGGQGPSRRRVLGMAAAALLAGGAGAGLAGCTWGGSSGPGPSPSPDPLAGVLTGTEALIDLYAATVAAQPSHADRLNPLLAEHRAHAAALREAMGLSAPSGSAHASATASTAVPEDPGAALAAVVGAERTAQAAVVKDCLAGRPEHASLLGSIAASRACHLEVLA